MKKAGLLKVGLAVAFVGILAYSVYYFWPTMETNQVMENQNQQNIDLPEPSTDGTLAVERAISQRRSVRKYSSEPLSLSDLSQIMWAAQGITGSGGKRSAPSAGALYPLELYVIALAVEDLPSGIYSYEPDSHTLSSVHVNQGILGQISEMAGGQNFVAEAPAILVYSAVYERSTGKYGERGKRYVHMEVGHSAQNVYLQAEALDMATVMVGYFDDQMLREAVRAGEGETMMALMPIGYTLD